MKLDNFTKLILLHWFVLYAEAAALWLTAVWMYLAASDSISLWFFMKLLLSQCVCPELSLMLFLTHVLSLLWQAVEKVCCHMWVVVCGDFLWQCLCVQSIYIGFHHYTLKFHVPESCMFLCFSRSGKTKMYMCLTWSMHLTAGWQLNGKHNINIGLC